MTTPERRRELASAQEPRAGLLDLFFLKPGPDVTELLLVRHGQVEPGDFGRDEQLTEIGQEQADVLGQYLARDKVDAVYASPMLRARETAEPVARAHSLQVQPVDALRDIDMLKPFDKPFPEAFAEAWGEENVEARLAWMREEMSVDGMAPFLQSSESFRERVQAGIDEILTAHAGQRIVAVTHGPVIAAYAALLMGSKRDFALQPRLTSLTRILARDGRRMLDYVNATPHFDAP